MIMHNVPFLLNVGIELHVLLVILVLLFHLELSLPISSLIRGQLIGRLSECCSALIGADFFIIGMLQHRMMMFLSVVHVHILLMLDHVKQARCQVVHFRIVFIVQFVG